MNKHILVAMDRKNRTKKELFDNVASADAATADAKYAASFYVAYAYAAASASAYASACVADCVVNDFFAVVTTHDATERWINEYFEVTGENKQNYIDAINKDNK